MIKCHLPDMTAHVVGTSRGASVCDGRYLPVAPTTTEGTAVGWMLSHPAGDSRRGVRVTHGDRMPPCKDIVGWAPAASRGGSIQDVVPT